VIWRPFFTHGPQTRCKQPSFSGLETGFSEGRLKKDAPLITTTLDLSPAGSVPDSGSAPPGELYSPSDCEVNCETNPAY